MRLTYIDNLKGLVILLVVMGHICLFTMGVKGTAFTLFYTSFYMPLMFFLSGIFAFRKSFGATKGECYGFLRSRAIRIMLPYLVVGGLYGCLFADSIDKFFVAIGGYWFLPVLFMCSVMSLCSRMLSYPPEKVAMSGSGMLCLPFAYGEQRLR